MKLIFMKRAKYHRYVMSICILSGILLSNYGLLNQLDLTNPLNTAAPLVRAGGELDMRFLLFMVSKELHQVLIH
jgi:hypothetical protein